MTGFSTHRNIIHVIIASGKGNFEEIDDVNIPDLFKWKVAFLYSNQRLIPIYKREILFKIAKFYGMEITTKIKISEIQRLMIENKPVDLDVFQYMWFLFQKFADKKEKEETTERVRRTRRAAAKGRNTQSQTRTTAVTYFAEQKHNKIQEALEIKLVEKYGRENVILEENFVDLKVIQKHKISLYEVKSAAYASDCIKEALGQILMYYFYEKDVREKEIFIVGQFKASKKEKDYIDFIKANLKIDFNYINVSI